MMKITAVTTLYYSSSYIHEVYSRLVAAIKKITDNYEIIFVNDGSPDDSLEKAVSIRNFDSNVIVIDLSRNFGHHKAIISGLEHASGDYVFLIDADLEEDPELIGVFWKKMLEDGQTDVVYGIQQKRKGKWFEQLSGQIYYKIFDKITDIHYPADTLTARLMKKEYVKAVLLYPEKELDLWCLFILAGFKQISVIVNKGYKGKTTYTLVRKINIAINTITSFSSKPLMYIFLVGLIVTCLSLISILYLIYLRFILKEYIDGWASILVSLWFLGGVLIFCIGIIGIYLSKMFLEIKNRPNSIIKKTYK